MTNQQPGEHVQRPRTVFLAVRTYNYEDEHGGVTHGVFASEDAAIAYVEARRSERGPYTWCVEDWDIQDSGATRAVAAGKPEEALTLEQLAYRNGLRRAATVLDRSGYRTAAEVVRGLIVTPAAVTHVAAAQPQEAPRTPAPETQVPRYPVAPPPGPRAGDSTTQVRGAEPSPGPWRMCKGRGDVGGQCQCGLIWSIPADCVVATVNLKDESGEFSPGVFAANGRLIASAPDLVVQLAKARSDLDAARREGRVEGLRDALALFVPLDKAATDSAKAEGARGARERANQYWAQASGISQCARAVNGLLSESGR